MASIHPHPSTSNQTGYKIRFALKIGGRSRRRDKYAKTESQTNRLFSRAHALEKAATTGVAHESEIDGWLHDAFLTSDEAGLFFDHYRQLRHIQEETEQIPADLEAVHDAYIERSIRRSAGGATGQTHSSNKSRARKLTDRLKRDFPDLARLTPDEVKRLREDLRYEGQSSKTVYHIHGVLRLMLDEAVRMKMIRTNPARAVASPQAKTTKSRRILRPYEIQAVLEKSLTHTHGLNGALPIAVRLGLYAGLRNSEMVWLRWEHVDCEARVLRVVESHSSVIARKKLPKDGEKRILDIKPELASAIREERTRQERLGILGEFVIRGRSRLRPAGPGSVQDVFGDMVRDEGMDPEITVYSMRHTYATSLLRAGIDIRTVQKRMGHSDLKTTMEYLDYVDVDAHPTDALPY